MKHYILSDRGRPLRQFPLRMLEEMLLVRMTALGEEYAKAFMTAWHESLRRIEKAVDREIRR